MVAPTLGRVHTPSGASGARFMRDPQKGPSMSRSIVPRRRLARLGLVVSAAAVLVAGGMAFAGSAQAGTSNPHSPAYGHPYRHGAVPTRENHNAVPAASAHNLRYGGGGRRPPRPPPPPPAFLPLFGPPTRPPGPAREPDTTPLRGPPRRAPPRA